MTEEPCLVGAAGVVWHRWVPIEFMGMPGELPTRLPASEARVVEVCPACKQWRVQEYSRHLAPPPVDPG